MVLAALSLISLTQLKVGSTGVGYFHKNSEIYLDEAYIDFYKGNFDVRLGKQIYAWGRADGFNPTDNLSVWDFSDILDTDDEKIGLLSAQVKYYWGSITLEAVLAPTFTASVLPGMDSRWWPEMESAIPNPAFPNNGYPTIPVNYSLEPSLLPDEGLEGAQYAFKISGLFRGWDYSFSWFDGVDDLPGIHTMAIFDSAYTQAEITLQNQYHRRRTIGADFATTFGKVGFRGETAYYITDDWKGNKPAVDDPYLQYILGIDYTFREVFPDKNIFVLLQWSHEIQVPERNATYRITDLNHIFRRSLMGKVDLDLGDYSKLTLEGVYNLYSNGWWLQPGLEWSITDGLKLNAGMDLLGGPEDSFFGTFKNNIRVQLELKYEFTLIPKTE